MAIVPILSILIAAAATTPTPVPAPVAPAPPPAAVPDPWLAKVFLYFRATAFRDMVAEKMCGGGQVRAEFDSLSARLEKARRRLSDRSHRAMFHTRHDEITRWPQCSDPDAYFTMRGFANAVAELELAAEQRNP